MSSNISVCTVIFEMSDPIEKLDSASGPPEVSTDVTQGRREPRDYSIETYSGRKMDQKSFFGKSRSVSESSARLGSSEREAIEEDGKERDTMTFFSGNPYVETTRGILHLYKENALSTLEAGSARCDSVCILAVPAAMTCTDLLSFTAPVHEDVKFVRIIRDGTPNQYMALLTFRSQLMAREFYTAFNGVPFNSLEPDCVCQMVFVSKVEIKDSPPQPPAMHTELPTCPVCLERMDESVDGILTILCNHSFHSGCLAKWADTSCPVCRYFQTPEMMEENHCLQCLSEDNLWICLICGHIGCGRYVQGHAYEHYQATQHCYAMQLGSNRVWDYAGDNFVHRLLQNKGDGKLVDGGEPSKDSNIDEKLDSLQLEWTYSLTSQLEQQKQYFEEKLNRLQQASNERSDIQQKLGATLGDNKSLQAEKAALEKKVAQLTNRLASALAQMQDEKEMAKALQRNQKEWQEKYAKLEQELKQKDKEIEDMNEKLMDYAYHCGALQGVISSGMTKELSEGQIVIPDRAEPPTKPRRKRR